MRSRLPATAFLGAVAWFGPQPVAASDPELNEWCPVMTEERAHPEITTEYQGKRVAFCCPKCLAKFTSNPEKYLPLLPQFGGRHPMEASAAVDQGAPEGPGHGDESAPAAEVATTASREDGAERVPFLGRVHPVLVHFPLAGMPLALLGLAVWMRTGQTAFAKADVVPLVVATLASIAAVITGNIAHDHMQFSGARGEIVERHEVLSTTVMVLCICLTVLRTWRWNRLADRWRWVYAAGLCLACALLVATGYLGGSLVFGPDHLWP